VRLRQPGAEQQIARALTLARELVQQFPDVPSYHDLLGSMHEERGFLLEHADHFGEAERAYRDMLDCYEELRRDHPTAAPYQQAVFRARLWLGEVLWSNSDAEGRTEAKEEFKQAFDVGEQIAPRDPFGQYLFAWFLANIADPEMRDPVRAAEMAQTVVELVPEFGDSWITLGIAHYRAGDYQAAVDALEKGARLPTHYDSCPSQFFWAMAQWRLGQQDEALRHYRLGIGQMNREYDMLEFRRVRDEAAELLGLPLPASDQLRPGIDALPTVTTDDNQPTTDLERITTGN
jgi:tetratricopeptide (TPR) repeat protein